MTAVYGLYTTGDAAQRAVNGLRAAGYADRDITVISAAPMEEYEFSHIMHVYYLRRDHRQIVDWEEHIVMRSCPFVHSLQLCS